MTLTPLASPRTGAAALAAALAVALAPSAVAADQQPSGWEKDGLRLNAEQNNAVEEFADRAERAEKLITPQIRTAAAWSGAELVGLNHRLKSEDSLKRKVATKLKYDANQSVYEALEAINDSVRYTFRWADEEYTEGTRTAAMTLAAWRHENVRWSNTWKNRNSYKAVNATWRDALTDHKYEIQFHTPASHQAAVDTHPLYEEQRLPGTPPERVTELAAEQGRIFAAVPTPEGAEELAAPMPVGVPAR